MTPEQFYADTVGKQIDVDGYPKNQPYQCVDLFRYWGQMNSVPIPPTPNNYASGYWLSRDALGFSKWFTYVTDGNYKTGDWVIWNNGSRSHPSSHIAMYYYGQEFGENQGGNASACLKTTDFSDALGGLRWKGNEHMEISKGFSTREWNGIKIDTIRGTYSNGYRLHLISAGDAFALKRIMAFDSDRLAILGAINANYFDNTPGSPTFGMHLGVEGDGWVRGYFQAPKEAGILAYYITDDGKIGAHDQSDFWLGQDQIQVAGAPYAVLIHQGQTVNLHSTAIPSKDLELTTQSAVMRIGDDWVLLNASKCYPVDILKFAQEAGANELIINDSGGSAQMFDCSRTGHRQAVNDTGREIPNVWVLAKEIDGPQEAPNEPIPSDPAEDEPTPTPEPQEPQEQPEHPTGWSNELFDIMRYMAEVGLPALSVLIATVGRIMGLPYADKIAAVVMAVSVFVGSLVGIKRKQYTEATNERER